MRLSRVVLSDVLIVVFMLFLSCISDTHSLGAAVHSCRSLYSGTREYALPNSDWANRVIVANMGIGRRRHFFSRPKIDNLHGVGKYNTTFKKQV